MSNSRGVGYTDIPVTDTTDQCCNPECDAECDEILRSGLAQCLGQTHWPCSLDDCGCCKTRSCWYRATYPCRSYLLPIGTDRALRVRTRVILALAVGGSLWPTAAGTPHCDACLCRLPTISRGRGGPKRIQSSSRPP